MNVIQSTGASAQGVRAVPRNIGSVVVTENVGNYSVRITDPTPQYGESYFVEYATKPDFSNAVLIYDGASRSTDVHLNLGVSTYWRCYKQFLGSQRSAYITYGSPPISVAGTGTGAAPPAGTGSGTSGSSGAGFGNPGGSGGTRKLQVL